MYCKNCLRALHQISEKAIGDGEVQMVWANDDGQWICSTNNNETHDPTKLNPFIFTNVDPFIMAGRGEAYYFTFQGSDYYVEDWATDNASGEDIYDADTERGVYRSDIFKDDEQVIAFDEALEAAKNVWGELWSDIVAPVIEQAQQQAVLKWSQS